MNKTNLVQSLFLFLILTSCSNPETAQNAAITDTVAEIQKPGNSTLATKIDEQAEANDYEETTTALDGKWTHEEDSLAFVKINGTDWIFGYEDQEIDKYNFKVVDELPQYADPGIKAKFLILSNQVDTIYYELNGVTTETLSLTWYPEGKLHVYRKKN